MQRLLQSAALAALPIIITAASANAQSPASVESFYKDKKVRMLVGYGVGTGNDLYMRLLARHIGKHIPGKPTIAPENMPGAGSMVMMNYLYNTAARDGTAIGVPSRNLAVEPLLGNAQARYDALKFTWLGSMSRDVSTCITWHTSGIKTIEDAKRREVPVGATGATGRQQHLPEAHQCRARHSVQDRARLSRQRRGRHRDGARRTRWLLQLHLVSHQVGAPAMAGAEADQRRAAAQPERACGTAGRAGGDGSGEGRRLAQVVRARLRHAEDGPSGRGAARRSGRTRTTHCGRPSTPPWPIRTFAPTPSELRSRSTARFRRRRSTTSSSRSTRRRRRSCSAIRRSATSGEVAMIRATLSVSPARGRQDGERARRVARIQRVMACLARSSTSFG